MENISDIYKAKGQQIREHMDKEGQQDRPCRRSFYVTDREATCIRNFLKVYRGIVTSEKGLDRLEKMTGAELFAVIQKGVL